MLDPRVAEQLPGDPDPALRNEVAHQSARAIVSRCQELAGSEPIDPELVDRLIGLVDAEGIEAVAAVWSSAEPVTLPGALWRLYLLRERVRRNPEAARLQYRLGAEVTPVAAAIAGLDEYPAERDLLDLADAVLSGFYLGDLSAALDRASAYCRVLAAGAAHDADARDQADLEAGRRTTLAAAGLQRTANELREAAVRARAGLLD